MHDHITTRIILTRIILRSKSRWYDEGEKNSKYFLSLEKSNKSQSHIRRLIADIEEITHQRTSSERKKFLYGNLYLKKSVKIEIDCLHCLASIN